MIQFVSNDTLLENDMNIFDYIPQIATHPLFKNVEKETVAKYLCDDNIELKTYSASQTIISRENNLQIFAIVSGTVEILSQNENHKVILKTSGAGTIFGVANIYTRNAIFPSTVIAKKQTTVLMISHSVFKNMLNNEATLMNNYLEFLSNKIIYLNKKISSYTAGNSENKLLYFLTENEIDGTVALDMSLSDIAIMLDMGRASLYRALDKLESEDLIKRNGKTITIINEEKLKKYIN